MTQYDKRFTEEEQDELGELSARIMKWVDKGIRHNAGCDPQKYLEHFLQVGREYAYATHDDSWGEFEKEFSTIVCRMVLAERKLEMLEARGAFVDVLQR